MVYSRANQKRNELQNQSATESQTESESKHDGEIFSDEDCQPEILDNIFKTFQCFHSTKDATKSVNSEQNKKPFITEFFKKLVVKKE